jgi:hypothetical protein
MAITRRVLVSLGISDTVALHSINWYSTYATIPMGDDDDDLRAVVAWLAANPDTIAEGKD